MAKLNAKRALEDYKSSNNDFFKLENDMDVATVRFLYDHEEELDIYAVHEAEIKGKKRYVECLQTGDCPFCQASAEDKDLKVKVKFFIQLEDEDGKVKTWERGQTFIPKILGMFNKYGPLCNRLYEIERHGKPKDTKTTYELYALDKDESTLDDLPEKQELLGDFVLQWDANKMDAWLNGEDVGGDEPEPEQPQRRNSRGGSQQQQQPQGRGASAGNNRAQGRVNRQEPAETPTSRGATGSRAQGNTGRGASAGGANKSQPAPRNRQPVDDSDVF